MKKERKQQMLKSFNEMLKVDISNYVKERDGISYLPWAECKKLLHDNGAEKVYFEPCVNSNGSSLFMSDAVFTDKSGVSNRCYEVRVKVVIDDLVFESQYPLMNGTNPVKDNSMSQQRVYNAQARAFVKGVAIHTGLGFGLWLKDDVEQAVEDDLSKHSIQAIKVRTQQTYTQKLQKKMSTKDIAQALDMTEEEVRVYFTYYDILDRFERRLSAL
jgi:hypothetical protein